MREALVKIYVIVTVMLTVGMAAGAAQRTSGRPDFDVIEAEIQKPESEFYYPKLLKLYLSSDTTMTPEQYHYLYYGMVFQEDYNPYRVNPYEAETKAAAPLYSRAGARSRNENNQVQKLAERTIASNPFDLRQMSSLIYTYGAMGKDNLRKIWQHKFDKILYTISRSGSGADQEHAIVIVDPSNIYDFFFFGKFDIEDEEFVEPYYERFTVRAPKATESKQYWFDLHKILEQYYLKHPMDDKE